MRYVSLFSGIEAASVAWETLGWEPVAFAEIEPFPCKVLEKRFPDVPNLGDVSKIDWSPYVGAVDLVVGGSPCQAFSVAGRRRGLMDERGRLMLEYVRAVRDLRPRWLLWENVPGVLSQDGGRAFGTLLGALEDCGYSLAWRVLDAQFFGVAQRRRRVFLVGHLGADVGAAASVLFERDSVPGNTVSGRKKREELAALPEGRLGGGGGCLTPWESQARTVRSEDGPFATLAARESSGGNSQAVAVRTSQTGANGIGVSDAAHALDVSGPEAVCYGFPHAASGKAVGYGVSEDLAPTMRAAPQGENSVCYGFAQNSRDEVRLVNGDGKISGALEAEPGIKHTTFVATQYGGDVAGTLTARGDGSPCADRGPNVVCVADDNANAAVGFDVSGTLKCGGGVSVDSYIVRRLTPRECERLQGFPDDWTKIDDGTPDTPRYKALGNSMAVPCMRWIGERIQMVDEMLETEECE